MTEPPADESTDFELQGFPVQEPENELRSREPVEILATQFVDEIREGGAPSVDEYARRYPLHAEVIQESFPVLAILEQARLQNEAAAIRQSMPETFPFSRLGRCELLCELGRGGMGVVFQARETDSNHIVAVKLLPWRVSIVPEWQKNFEVEARTTAKLRHRNIVPVFRFGQEHGYCYFVMQFVNGIGLDVIVKRLQEVGGVVYQDEIEREASAKPQGFVSSVQLPAIRTLDDIKKASEPRRKKLTRTSWKSFTHVAIQVAQALRYAHSHGLLHNDIKPGNILLDGGGRAWVTDFGLSEPIETPEGAKKQRVMGTLRYMAPERLMGEHDERSDIYSFGITLYELLTLQPAFVAGSEESMVSKVMEETPANPRELVSDVPRGLETIVLNCISRFPAERYKSAEALLVDLLRFSRDQRIASLRPWKITKIINNLTGNSPPIPKLRDYFDQ